MRREPCHVPVADPRHAGGPVTRVGCGRLGPRQQHCTVGFAPRPSIPHQPPRLPRGSGRRGPIHRRDGLCHLQLPRDTVRPSRPAMGAPARPTRGNRQTDSARSSGPAHHMATRQTPRSSRSAPHRRAPHPARGTALRHSANRADPTLRTSVGQYVSDDSVTGQSAAPPAPAPTQLPANTNEPPPGGPSSTGTCAAPRKARLILRCSSHRPASHCLSRLLASSSCPIRNQARKAVKRASPRTLCCPAPGSTKLSTGRERSFDPASR